MRDENARAREKFDLSLDGRQIASIVVAALVILGVVFVLGLNVGRQVAARQAEATRGGDLEALDRVPVAAAPAKNDITFYDQLPKGRPAPPPPVEPKPAAAPAAPSPAPAAAPPAPAAATAATPTPTPTAAAAVTPSQSPSPPATPPRVETAPRPSPPPASPHPPPPAAHAAAPGAFCVQLAATQSRAEADKIAARYRGLSPRVEAADVPGKGRFYRVRAGNFASRTDAERFLHDASRETGAKGFVTASK